MTGAVRGASSAPHGAQNEPSSRDRFKFIESRSNSCYTLIR